MPNYVENRRRKYRTMVQISLMLTHQFIHLKIPRAREWVNERVKKRMKECSWAHERSKKCGVSEWVSGPVLTSWFMAVLYHSGSVNRFHRFSQKCFSLLQEPGLSIIQAFFYAYLLHPFATVIPSHTRPCSRSIGVFPHQKLWYFPCFFYQARL